jgi:hypothetical protein
MYTFLLSDGDLSLGHNRYLTSLITIKRPIYSISFAINLCTASCCLLHICCCNFCRVANVLKLELVLGLDFLYGSVRKPMAAFESLCKEILLLYYFNTDQSL